MSISAPMTITWRAGRCSLPLIALLAESRYRRRSSSRVVNISVLNRPRQLLGLCR